MKYTAFIDKQSKTGKELGSSLSIDDDDPRAFAFEIAKGVEQGLAILDPKRAHATVTVTVEMWEE